MESSADHPEVITSDGGLVDHWDPSVDPPGASLSWRTMLADGEHHPSAIYTHTNTHTHTDLGLSIRLWYDGEDDQPAGSFSRTQAAILLPKAARTSCGVFKVGRETATSKPRVCMYEAVGIARTSKGWSLNLPPGRWSHSRELTGLLTPRSWCILIFIEGVSDLETLLGFFCFFFLFFFFLWQFQIRHWPGSCYRTTRCHILGFVWLQIFAHQIVDIERKVMLSLIISYFIE